MFNSQQPLPDEKMCDRGAIESCQMKDSFSTLNFEGLTSSAPSFECCLSSTQNSRVDLVSPVEEVEKSIFLVGTEYWRSREAEFNREVKADDPNRATATCITPLHPVVGLAPKPQMETHKQINSLNTNNTQPPPMTKTQVFAETPASQVLVREDSSSLSKPDLLEGVPVALAPLIPLMPLIPSFHHSPSLAPSASVEHLMVSAPSAPSISQAHSLEHSHSFPDRQSCSTRISRVVYNNFFVTKMLVSSFFKLVYRPFKGLINIGHNDALAQLFYEPCYYFQFSPDSSTSEISEPIEDVTDNPSFNIFDQDESDKEINLCRWFKITQIVVIACRCLLIGISLAGIFSILTCLVGDHSLLMPSHIRHLSNNNDTFSLLLNNNNSFAPLVQFDWYDSNQELCMQLVNHTNTTHSTWNLSNVVCFNMQQKSIMEKHQTNNKSNSWKETVGVLLQKHFEYLQTHPMCKLFSSDPNAQSKCPNQWNATFYVHERQLYAYERLVLQQQAVASGWKLQKILFHLPNQHENPFSFPPPHGGNTRSNLKTLQLPRVSGDHQTGGLPATFHSIGIRVQKPLILDPDLIQFPLPKDSTLPWIHSPVAQPFVESSSVTSANGHISKDKQHQPQASLWQECNLWLSQFAMNVWKQTTSVSPAPPSSQGILFLSKPADLHSNMHTLIEAYSPIPSPRIYEHKLWLDGSSSWLNLEIYEGESPHSKDNILLSQFHLNVNLEEEKMIHEQQESISKNIHPSSNLIVVSCHINEYHELHLTIFTKFQNITRMILL